MTEEYTFPNFEEPITKLLEPFGGKKMETYHGKDIKCLWDLKGGALKWSFKYLYEAPKLEKIVYGVQCYRDKLMTYTTSIWPTDEYALPIYSFFWAESSKASFFLMDLYPLADCSVDDDYMEKYIVPTDDAYEDIGLKLFPSKSIRDPSWWRALASPNYITADFSPSTKETQGQIIELASEYLKVYTEMWEKEEPADPEYMKQLLTRKNRMRFNLIDKDPGGFMLEKALGKELADLSLEALF